jgi:hypothetical protein
LNCCGVNGASEDFRQQHKHVPWSCCYKPQEADDDRKNCEKGCHHPVIHRTQSILLYTFLLALSSIILKVIKTKDSLIHVLVFVMSRLFSLLFAFYLPLCLGG